MTVQFLGFSLFKGNIVVPKIIASASRTKDNSGRVLGLNYGLKRRRSALVLRRSDTHCTQGYTLTGESKPEYHWEFIK